MRQRKALVLTDDELEEIEMLLRDMSEHARDDATERRCAELADKVAGCGPTVMPEAEGPLADGVSDALGRLVREEWIAWAREQPPPVKLTWLIPWEGLCRKDREVDRRVGERLYRVGLRAAGAAIIDGV